MTHRYEGGNMKSMKKMLVLMAVVTMLFLTSSYAEGLTEGQTPIPPTEQDMSVDMPTSDALDGEANNGEADTATLDSLQLDTASANLDYAQRLTLTATTSVSGENVQWSSSDEKVATISASSGESVEVVAVNEGTSIITCSAGDVSQTCAVTVNAPQALQITGVDYPSTFRINGWGWKLRNGTVASTVDLATLTSVIKNANGEEVGSAYTHTFDESIRRFDVRGIDNFVPFSRIAEAGAYTWTLSATDIDGRMVSMELPINAVNDAETVIAVEKGSYFTGEMVSTDNSSGAEPAAGANLLVGTGMPVSQAFNTPTAANGSNFAVFDPYHTYGNQTLEALGFAAGDKITFSFDWSISKNGNLDLLYGNFRAEWVGWKNDVDGQYIEAIQYPVDTFAADHTSGRAQVTVTLSEAALRAHTIRIRVDISTLTLTLSHAKLERGEVTDPVWTPAIEDAQDLLGEENDSDSQNLLEDANTPISRSFNTPSVPEEKNYEVFDPYHTAGKQTLQALGLVAGDVVTVSFDWSISKNGDLDPLYGDFRVEWIGWKDGVDGQYIAAIQNPVDTFGADHTQGHAQFTTTLSEEALQAHTLRIRVDNSVLMLTISNAKLLRGEVENQD